MTWINLRGWKSRKERNDGYFTFKAGFENQGTIVPFSPVLLNSMSVRISPKRLQLIELTKGIDFDPCQKDNHDARLVSVATRTALTQTCDAHRCRVWIREFVTPAMLSALAVVYAMVSVPCMGNGKALIIIAFLFHHGRHPIGPTQRPPCRYCP